MQWFLVLVGGSGWLMVAVMILAEIGGLTRDGRMIAAAVFAILGTIAFTGLALLNSFQAFAKLYIEKRL